MKSLIKVCFILGLSLAALTGCLGQRRATQEAPAPGTATQPPQPTQPTAAEAPAVTIIPLSTLVPPTATTVSATATFSPEEPVTTQRDIIGTWQGRFLGELILISYFPDDTYMFKWLDTNIRMARGGYRIENSQLIFRDRQGVDSCKQGTWNVFVTRQGDKPVRLRYERMEDECEDRNLAFKEEQQAADLPPVPFTPAELPVSRLKDVLGTWMLTLEGEPSLIEFQEDGLYNLRTKGNLTAVERGDYGLLGNLLHFLKSPRECPGAEEATYEVYVSMKDGKPNKLYFLLVGEDGCANREQALNGKLLTIFTP